MLDASLLLPRTMHLTATLPARHASDPAAALVQDTQKNPQHTGVHLSRVLHSPPTEHHTLSD